MARKRKSPRRGRNDGRWNTVLGVFIGGAALCGFVTIGWFGFTESQKPLLDPVTLCLPSGPTGYLAVLLDLTDPVSVTQLQAARDFIESRIDKAEVGTRISLTTVSPDPEKRRISFRSICKPPSGEDASVLTENPRLIEKTYQDGFLGPLHSSLTDLMTAQSADSSPILEGLQEFLTAIPGFTSSTAPREVILFTDLMQNSDAFSLYHGGSWKSFVADGNADRLSRNLAGVNVTVLRLPPQTGNTDVVDDFWVNYFETQGIDQITTRTIGDL